MEVLLHLKWDAFCSWVSKGGGGGVESEGGSILNLANNVIERYRTATRAEEKKEAYLLLCNTATYVEGLLTRFKQEIVIETFQVSRQVHRDDSPSSRVDLSRTRGWLGATSKGYNKDDSIFFCNGSLELYSRWLSVYNYYGYAPSAEKALDVYNEFVRGNHPIRRSTSQSFNQVWTDMALEQNINLDRKTKGGIIGITQRLSALQKWFLTAYERTATTTATKRVIDLDESTRRADKESPKVRVQRDEMTSKRSYILCRHSCLIPLMKMHTERTFH